MRLSSLLVLLVCPAFACAALPQLSTDTLAPGEMAIGAAVSFVHDEADVDGLISATPVTGDAQGDVTAFVGTWSYGAAERIEIGAQAWFLDQSSGLALNGAPGTLDIDTRASGWGDLHWYALWRIHEREKTAFAVKATVVSPTASDSDAVPETRINGVVVPPAAEEGDVGGGDTRIAIAGGVSHRLDRNAVEGFVEWHTEDNDLADDTFVAGGRFLHFNSERQRVWLAATGTLLGAQDNTRVQKDSQLIWRLEAGITWQPKPNVEFGFTAGHAWIEDSRIVYPASGNQLDFNDATRLVCAAGMRILLP